MDLFIAAGIIIRHQFAQQIVQYELREMAEKHIHLVCVECGALKEIKKKELDDEEAHLPKYRGFHPQCKIDYVYGLCSKCRRKSDKTIKRK
jgi:Fur family ferric uptake transcriptional regulator